MPRLSLRPGHHWRAGHAVPFGILGTMVAWALVNTVYAIKYARIYYDDHDCDGFDVKQGGEFGAAVRARARRL